MEPFFRMKSHFNSDLECKYCNDKYGKLDIKTIIHELSHRLDVVENNKDNEQVNSLKKEIERYKHTIRCLEYAINYYFKRNSNGIS